MTDQSVFSTIEFPYLFYKTSSEDRLMTTDKAFRYSDIKRILRSFTTAYLEFDVEFSGIPDEGKIDLTEGLNVFANKRIGVGNQTIKELVVCDSKGMKVSLNVSDSYLNPNFTSAAYILGENFNNFPCVVRKGDQVSLYLSSDRENECFYYYTEIPVHTRRGVIHGAYNEGADDIRGYSIVTDTRDQGLCYAGPFTRSAEVFSLNSERWEKPARQTSVAMRCRNVDSSTFFNPSKGTISYRMLLSMGALYNQGVKNYCEAITLKKQYVIA